MLSLQRAKLNLNDMAKGNDDLLFGQPNNLDEAVDTLIAFYGENRFRLILKKNVSLYDSKTVYNLAGFIRNNWFLWWHDNHNSKWFPASKPPLLSFFHDVGITHPDDMSDINFSAIWHRLLDKPYDLLDTVQALQAYWK